MSPETSEDQVDGRSTHLNPFGDLTSHGNKGVDTLPNDPNTTHKFLGYMYFANLDTDYVTNDENDNNNDSRGTTTCTSVFLCPPLGP